MAELKAANFMRLLELAIPWVGKINTFAPSLGGLLDIST
jgi:hypothetical protein